MPHQQAASGLRLVPALLSALCMVALLPTLATATRTETINSSTFERKNLTEPSVRICLELLAGGGDFDAKLRLEVVPKSGSNVLYLATNVDVTKELLQKVSGVSQLRYEYTTADQKVGLKVTLNGEELPYTSYQDFSSAQHKFNLVKFYIKGHVQVTYDCPEVVDTTTIPTTTTPTTTTPTTTPTTTTTPTSTTPVTTKNSSQGRKTSILTQLATPSSSEEDQDKGKEAGVSAAGGSTSTLHIVLIVVVALVVVVGVVVSVVLWRRKRRSTRPNQLHVAEVVPLHLPANVGAIQSTNTGIKSFNNPVYRPTTTTNG